MSKSRKNIAFIDGKTFVDGKQVARAKPAVEASLSPAAREAGAAFQRAMASRRSQMGIEAPQASVDVMAQLKEINAANQKHLKEQAEKVEAHEEEIDTLNCHVRELNNKIEAAHRAPRNGDGQGFMGGDSLNVANSRRRLGMFARGGPIAIQNEAMGTDVDREGGFTVADEHDFQIRRLADNVSVMRTLSGNVTISGDTYTRLVDLKMSDAAWVGERDSRDLTKGLDLARITFGVHEMSAMPAVTQKLLDDAKVDVAAELSINIATKFNELESAAFVTGDGVGKPMGLLSYPTVADPSWTWGKLGFLKTGQATDFIAATTTAGPGDVLIDLTYRLAAKYRQNASWVMNSATAARVRKFRDVEGRYIWTESLVAGQPSLLLGKPVYIDDNFPDIGAGTFPIAYGDFSQGYLVIDRLGIRLLRDPYTMKPNVLFYTTKRVGGGMQNYQAVKLIKISA